MAEPGRKLPWRLLPKPLHCLLSPCIQLTIRLWGVHSRSGSRAQSPDKAAAA